MLQNFLDGLVRHFKLLDWDRMLES